MFVMFKRAAFSFVLLIISASVLFAQAPKVEPAVKWSAHPLGVDRVAISADGSTAAVLGSNEQGAGSLKVFQTSDQKVLATSRASSKFRRGLAVNIAGTQFAWFSDESAPVLGNLKTGDPIKRLKPPESRFISGGYLAFTNADKKLIAVDSSRLHAWKITDSDPPETLDLKRNVYAFTMFPKADVAIIGHEEGNWRLLFLAERKILPFDQSTTYEALETAASLDGSQFAARNYEDAAIIWNADPIKKVGILPGTANLGQGLAFSPRGDLVAAPTAVGAHYSLFQLPGGKQVAELRGLAKFVTDVHFSANGKYVIGGDRQGTVAIWDISKIAAKPTPKIDGRPEFQIRTWVSADGAYRIEAKFVSATKTAVELLTKEGKQLSVPIEKLSRGDQALIRAIVSELEK